MASVDKSTAGSQPRASFTGRTRQRRTTWTVRAVDKLAHGLVVTGGLGTIVAVSMVFFFLLWVVLPLFWPAAVESAQSLSPAWQTARPLHLEADDQQVAAWALFPNGVLEFFQLGDNVHLGNGVQPGKSGGRVIDRQKIVPEGAVTAVALVDESAAIGLDEGTIRIGRIGFRSVIVGARNLDPKVQDLGPNEVLVDGPSLIQRTPAGQFRRLTVAAEEFGEPLETGSSAAIKALDMTMRPSGPAIVALSADGSLRLHTLKQRRSLESDEVTYRLRSVDLEYESSTPPDRVLISGVGDNAFAVWKNGRLLRFTTSDPAGPQIAEEVDLLGDKDAHITSLEFMVGKTTLVVGDSLGRVRAWFRTYRPDADTPDKTELVVAHELAPRDAAVTALDASNRTRVLAAGYADGVIRLTYLTTANKLVELQSQPAAPVERLAVSPSDNGILALAGSQLGFWRLGLSHPEVSFRALFLPVWYEGESGPKHIWQSSGGTEPKLGMMPLVFGTFKATAYSLLFGVPLALLAAIYTSEFLHPRVRARIKPTIELMASLPSVVLGFLAGVVLAPLAQRMIAEILSSFVTLPFAMLLGAYMWQILPSAARVLLGPWRLLLICLTLPCGVIAARWLGPAVEQWLFAGNIRLWLNGDAGTGTGGWFLLLLPLCALAITWIVATYVNPVVRSWSENWNVSRLAMVEFFKFIVASMLTLGVALAASALLTLLGNDPRGTWLASYQERNALLVGFAMGFAVIPLIYTIAEDALSSVPEHLRSASLGAGATPWQTATRIIIPTAMSGLFSAVMIGLGRAVGETMIVLMAAGSTPIMDWNIFNGLRSLSANIAEELPEAVRDSSHYRTLFLAALLLFSLTFVLNTVAEMVRQRFRKRAFQL